MPSVINVVAVALIPSVSGHGQMTFPPTRFDTTLSKAGSCEGGGCLFFNQGCQPGCSACTDKPSGDTCSEPGGTMAPTLNDQRLRTYMNVAKVYDWTKVNPWRSPGYSPVGSPCGLAGGGPTKHPGNGATAPPGVKQGFDGRLLPEGSKTSWVRGSVQEVAWSIRANHGGGYAYRLCPKTGNLTEECFQAHHLEFPTNVSWIEYGNDKSNRTAITAQRVSIGTLPTGSTWTKNPIPACNSTSGGVGSPICKGPQFEPPLPGLFGYGGAACTKVSAGAGGDCTQEQYDYWHAKFNFNIIDTVQVPMDFDAGEYALSFRWDCEQTPQVWTQCADITIVDAAQSSVLV